MPDTCLVVEFANPNSPLAQFTTRNRGTLLDLAIAPATSSGGSRMYRAALLATNCTPPQATQVRDALVSICKRVTIEPFGATSYLCSAEFDDAMVQGPSRILSSFDRDLGRKWVRIDDGISYFYGVLRHPGEAADLLERVRAAFQKNRLEAQMEVMEVPASHSGIWHALQAALGETSGGPSHPLPTDLQDGA